MTNTTDKRYLDAEEEKNFISNKVVKNNFFISRYKKLVDDFELINVKERVLRINNLKVDEKQLVKRLRKKEVKLEKIPFLKFAYKYDADFSLGSTPEFLLGYYYLQGLASQIVSEVLSPEEKDIVLDMASAPGSKTTHLSQLMNNKGKIVAIDLNKDRLVSVRNNCERLGILNVTFVRKDARFVGDFGRKFSKILLDAPCSGNYCSEKDWFNKRTIDGVKDNVRLQRELLTSAYKVLEEGGELVYSTCSLEPEEDELIIDWLLDKFNDLELLKIDLSIGDDGITEFKGKKLNPELKKCKRFWPHKTGTEGFFIAKLRKKTTTIGNK